MNKVEYGFLEQLLHAPAPSGFERPIQDVVRTQVEKWSDEVSTDVHGNVVASLNPDSTPRVMLAGHCDQIGLIVKYIDENGYLYVDQIGGWDVQTLIGQSLQIWTKHGPINGVIARKAIHLLSTEERRQVPDISDLWIDIGASSRTEAEMLVTVGDPVTLALGVRTLQGDLISGPGMDDRVGVWVVMNALKLISKKNTNGTVGIYAVSTVQEEIGLRGAKTSAFHINPQVGIAVDVTHATDCPSINQTQHGKVQIGKGPVVFRGPNVNPQVFETLIQIAKSKKIDVQIVALSRAASNDGNVMQVNQSGMATGIIGIPNRYMHSPVEVVSLSDLTSASKLIAQFCLSLTEDSDFTP